MNILKNSLNTSKSLLLDAQKSRNSKNKFFHFAFAYKKNRLICIGQNNPEKTNTRAEIIHKMFNIQNTYPYLHAETDLIYKLIKQNAIEKNIKLVVVRLNKRGKLRNSKPCKKCNKIIKKLGISNVWWSTEHGFEQ